MERKGIRSFFGIIILCTAAIIWGSSFVAQKVGSGIVGPFTFIGIRTLLGSMVLIPFVVFSNLRGKNCVDYKKPNVSRAFKWGGLCGLFLFIATSLQQIGIEFTTVGKSAFLSALYVLFVPILSSLFFKKRIKWNVWTGVGLMLVGLYFLCLFGTGSIVFSKGDSITLGCSIFFAFQIMTIERAKNRVDVVLLSCIQFFTAGIISLVFALLLEEIDINAILSISTPILYSGVLSCGVAYTFQAIGQKRVEASAASLILSSESFFAVLFGAIILSEPMGINEILGCVFIFGAIIISQMAFEKKQAKINYVTISKEDINIAKAFINCSRPRLVKAVGLENDVNYVFGLCRRFINRDKNLISALLFVSDEKKAEVERYLNEKGNADDKIFYSMLNTAWEILQKYYNSNGSRKTV